MAAIDAHVHVQPWRMVKPDRLVLMTRGRADLDRVRRCMDEPGEFLRLLDEAGVEAAVLVNYVAPEVMGFTPEVNEWIAGYCRASPRRLIAMGSVHPLHQPDPGREVERLATLDIRALKVHPPHQLFAPNAYRTGEMPALADLYRSAERLGIPVMIHTGTSIFPGARNVYADPMGVDDVAVDFPRLTIVLAHAGRPLHVETAVFLARRHENVWLDVSSIPPSRLLHYLPRLEELAGKTLFGTDWPAPGVPSIRENLEAVTALPLSDGAKAKILRENARTVYGL